MFFIQKKTIHGLGEHSASQAVEHTFQEILGRNEFYNKLEAAMGKQGMIGWGWASDLI